MTKEKGIKNYVVLIAMFIIAMGLTIYLCNWYNVYDDYKKQTPVIRGTLSEITSEELDHYIFENPTSIIYMCTSSDMNCRNFESDFKKVINKYDLENTIIYLNLNGVDQDEFVKKFNAKYPNKVNLKSNYPAIVTFEEGKLDYILQGNDKEKLTITRTKQYIELNNIGE